MTDDPKLEPLILEGWQRVTTGLARSGDKYWAGRWWLPVTGVNVGRPVGLFSYVIRRKDNWQ